MPAQVIAVLVFILASPLWSLPLAMGIKTQNKSLIYEKISNEEGTDANQQHRFLIHALNARKECERYFFLFGLVLFVEITAFVIIISIISSLPK